ncbi:MAG: COX15/CtaA family protein, partial [Ferruginibacter sp.]
MRLIKKWTLATFILTFLVIIAGGVVRTTQSGMGCPDWPKCFGMWIPPTNESQLPLDFEKYLKEQDIDRTFNALHTWTEYINRLFGVLLGVFAIIQFWLIQKRKKDLVIAFKLAISFLIVVIITGLVGAIVVKLNLHKLSISLHLVLAIVLVQIQLALLMSVSNNLFKKTSGIKARRLLFVLLVLILIQTLFGTGVRMYVDDISKALNYQQRYAWFSPKDLPSIFLIHRTFSWIVLLSVLYIYWQCKKVAVLKKHLLRTIIIILTNITTGIVLYYLDMPKVVQPIHLLLATISITQVAFLILH